jgi:hypothetical protein
MIHVWGGSVVGLRIVGLESLSPAWRFSAAGSSCVSCSEAINLAFTPMG